MGHYQLIVTPMIDQGELFDIPSPCRRICELNNRGYCKGCFRSRDERLYWNQFTTFQKQLVVNLCEKRRLKVLSAKQQSAASNEEEIVIPQLDMFAPQQDMPVAPADTASPDTDIRASIAEPEHRATTESHPSEAEAEAEKREHDVNVSLFEEPISTDTDTPASSATENAALQQTITAQDSKEEKEEKEEKKPRARSQTRTRKADDSQLDMFS
ncbi:DUF1289 domain-containing protein [Thalassolituus alkanivorans]|uniref:DUF1289 domain-containing protein n=1 Tax=Thalassolituus alkanivorans TaxID=2881055 RepID=UPI001E4B2091|nr:DUF1289 domain-containing protein [Thalassolituus alkanivorans]MCB2385112.1 DUF1289 domain-containing protein [Thalassolituus alkanivorans]MCB2423393.1 DUF1289 domain-containing protein [Thalassolituus alkanivorans]